MRTDRQHIRDLKFLERVKSCPKEQLYQLWCNYQHWAVAQWKRVVLLRAFKREGLPVPEDPEWYTRKIKTARKMGTSEGMGPRVWVRLDMYLNTSQQLLSHNHYNLLTGATREFFGVAAEEEVRGNRSDSEFVNFVLLRRYARSILNTYEARGAFLDGIQLLDFDQKKNLAYFVIPGGFRFQCSGMHIGVQLQFVVQRFSFRVAFVRQLLVVFGEGTTTPMFPTQFTRSFPFKTRPTDGVNYPPFYWLSRLCMRDEYSQINNFFGHLQLCCFPAATIEVLDKAFECFEEPYRSTWSRAGV